MLVSWVRSTISQRSPSTVLCEAAAAERFTLVAEWQRRGRGIIIGEASYAFDRDRRSGEFAVSVADRWQRQGLGSALLCALQYRAISLGYVGLFGETLKSNVAMKDMARKAGFEVLAFVGLARNPLRQEA